MGEPNKIDTNKLGIKKKLRDEVAKTKFEKMKKDHLSRFNLGERKK